jgi:hypothetical protein
LDRYYSDYTEYPLSSSVLLFALGTSLGSRVSPDAQAQITNTKTVDGMANAQYIQKVLPTSGPATFQGREGTAKRAARNVAGRKAMVTMAMVFIEVLFLSAACAAAIWEDAS